MKNVRIAFKKLDCVTTDEMRKGKIKPGYEHVNVQMIFDIKMYGKFTRKARLVADGHITSLTLSITYSSVVSRGGVSISFLLESLNELDIFENYIGNAHLNPEFIEKPWT